MIMLNLLTEYVTLNDTSQNYDSHNLITKSMFQKSDTLYGSHLANQNTLIKLAKTHETKRSGHHELTFNILLSQTFRLKHNEEIYTTGTTFQPIKL